MDIYVQENVSLDLQGNVKSEIAFILIQGCAMYEGEKVSKGQMLTGNSGAKGLVELKENKRLLLLLEGPLPESVILTGILLPQIKQH